MIVYLYHVDFWIGKTINMQPKSNKFQDQINMYTQSAYIIFTLRSNNYISDNLLQLILTPSWDIYINLAWP